MPRRIKTIAAIQPNAGVRSWYNIQLNLFILDMKQDLEERLKEPAPRALANDRRNWEITFSETDINGAYDCAVRLTGDASSPNTQLNAALEAWGKKWENKVERLASEMAKQFAKRNFSATQKSFQSSMRKAGFTVKFQPTRESIEAYKATVAENVALIKSIQQQYATRVKGDVWRAVTNGSDLKSLSTTLVNAYGATRERAALIARDQNAKARTTIERTRRLELGITRAILQHSAAGKEPREAHVKMNGTEFDVEKGFWDEHEQRYVQPGELINCHCTSRGILPGVKT